MGGVYNVSTSAVPGTIPVIGTAPSWTYPLAPGTGPSSSNTIRGGVPTGPVSPDKLTSINPSHQALLMLGAEVLFVVALAAVAEYDPRWSHVAAGTLVVLWFLFLINHANDLGRWFAQLGG